MPTRCEIVGKRALPVFRALIAKELVNTYGLTQSEAANKLGKSQVAISLYVNSKRAYHSLRQFGDAINVLQEKACEVAEKLDRNDQNNRGNLLVKYK